MSSIGPDVALCFSPVAGERQKTYQWCLDLRGIRIVFQGDGLVRGASEDDSGVRSQDLAGYRKERYSSMIVTCSFVALSLIYVDYCGIFEFLREGLIIRERLEEFC